MDHPIDNADSTHIIENKLSQMSVSGTACPSEPEHQDSSGLSDNEQGVTYSEDVLLEAGVQIDLDSLAAADGGNAPLELFSQVSLVLQISKSVISYDVLLMELMCCCYTVYGLLGYK